jgi:murein DD-endopeptidase MepM/ murein hydrolase activator NlpD
MGISAISHLKNSSRAILIVLSLLLLQLNVPLPSGDMAFTTSADLSLPPDQPFNFWQPVRNSLAAAHASLQQMAEGLAAFPGSNRTFKIVKIESIRRDLVHLQGPQWPVKGSISSPFGMRRHPVTRKHSFHNGIDIRARQGTGISCPADGVVVSAGYAGLYGRLVKVRTSSGKTLYFGHMHRIKCKSGQKVKKGTIIGTVGSSGRATGPHLHFSVAAAGKYLNPLKYLGDK